jgi:3-hydroxyacyl-CoA dehydrogenase
VGANLMQLLMLAQEGEWDKVGGGIHSFQQMTATIKFCPRQVAARRFVFTRRGGSLMRKPISDWQRRGWTHSSRGRNGGNAVAHGGCSCGNGSARSKTRFAQSAEVGTALRRVFETMAMAKLSTSAAETRTLGLFAAGDRDDCRTGGQGWKAACIGKDFFRP